ncbi:MAG: hypothetical protein ACK4OM_07360, partial [Alphaproteobacteria bacterium]
NIIAGDGNDIIFGNNLDNNIVTGKGNDIIYPGSGKNYITCGKDSKKIVIKYDETFGTRDKIYNFKPNIDKIDISDFKRILPDLGSEFNNLNIKSSLGSLYITLPNTKIILSGITDVLPTDLII